MPPARWLPGLLLALALVAGAAWWLQLQSADQLRGEIALLQEERRELDRLRADNLRLAAALPDAARWEAMRADHAAVVRLRAEIERTRANLSGRERALATGRE